MICEECGNEIEDGLVVCPECGCAIGVPTKNKIHEEYVIEDVPLDLETIEAPDGGTRSTMKVATERDPQELDEDIRKIARKTSFERSLTTEGFVWTKGRKTTDHRKFLKVEIPKPVEEEAEEAAEDATQKPYDVTFTGWVRMGVGTTAFTDKDLDGPAAKSEKREVKSFIAEILKVL